MQIRETLGTLEGLALDHCVLEILLHFKEAGLDGIMRGGFRCDVWNWESRACGENLVLVL